MPTAVFSPQNDPPCAFGCKGDSLTRLFLLSSSFHLTSAAIRSIHLNPLGNIPYWIHSPGCVCVRGSIATCQGEIRPLLPTTDKVVQRWCRNSISPFNFTLPDYAQERSNQILIAEDETREMTIFCFLLPSGWQLSKLIEFHKPLALGFHATCLECV